jgi:alpha-beta hydrolase superfamily lysophospholipase
LPSGITATVLVVIISAGALLLLAASALAIYVLAIRAYHKIFDRPLPRPPYDKSPLKIEQDTIFGRGKNWFYTNRMDFLDIQIKSFDRIVLSGYYRPSDKKTTRTLVILVHGWKDHPSDMGAYAQMLLQKNDYHILIPHLRAHGMSQGRFIGYGLYDSQDIISWVRFMEKKLGSPLKIILFGRSMGAAAVLMAAASRKLSPSVAGIIADSPFDTFENQLMHTMKNKYHFRGKWFIKLVANIAQSRIGFPIKRAAVLPVAGRIKIPVLLFHGADDRFVSPEMSEAIYERLACPKRLVFVEKARHVMAFDVSPGKYSNEVEKFFKVCKMI